MGDENNTQGEKLPSPSRLSTVLTLGIALATTTGVAVTLYGSMARADTRTPVAHGHLGASRRHRQFNEFPRRPSGNKQQGRPVLGAPAAGLTRTADTQRGQLGASGSSQQTVAWVSIADPLMVAHPQFVANRECFAKKHNLTLVKAFETPQAMARNKGVKKHWGKVAYLRAVLPKFDWVLLTDSDALMTAPRGQFRSFLSKLGPDVHAVFPREASPDGGPQCQFSNYAMMIRNSRVGRRLVDLWWQQRHTQCVLQHNIDDQCANWKAIVLLLAELRGQTGVYDMTPWKTPTMKAVMKIFEAQMAALSGRPLCGNLDAQRIGPLLFSPTFALQLKQTFLVHCQDVVQWTKRPNLVALFGRAMIMHVGDYIYPHASVSCSSDCWLPNRTLCECDRGKGESKCVPAKMLDTWCDHAVNFWGFSKKELTLADTMTKHLARLEKQYVLDETLWKTVDVEDVPEQLVVT